MNKLGQTALKIYEVGRPYIKDICVYAADKAFAAKRSVKQSKKKAERHIRFMKLKQAVEVTANLVLLIAGLMAVAMIALEYIRKNEK